MCYSLGLLRVKGSMPAERAQELVSSKVTAFGLSMEHDIMGQVTDGASVMKKLGRLLPSSHQLCHCHGLHLAVVDVLYKKRHHTEQEDDKDEDEGEEDEDQDDNSSSFCEEEGAETDIELQEEYSAVVSKIRKIVKAFRVSPMRNDALQEACLAEDKKPLTLLIDTKTRWNSLLKMLDRFLEMKGIVAKTLVDLSLIDLYPSNSEIQLAKEMVNALEVVEAGALALGERSCTLATAEKTFEFMITRLDGQGSIIAGQLNLHIKERILERRNKDLSCLVSFLDDPPSYMDKLEGNYCLPLASSLDMAKTARDIYSRLFLKSQDQDTRDTNNNCSQSSSGEPPEKQSKSEELQAFLLTKKKDTEGILGPHSSPLEVLKCIKRELAVLECTGKRSACLDGVYQVCRKICSTNLKPFSMISFNFQALLALPPSSTEAERCFSAVGLLITKLRTRLNDDTIDTLFFSLLSSSFRKVKVGHQTKFFELNSISTF